jgi:hypothetical protein
MEYMKSGIDCAPLSCPSFLPMAIAVARVKKAKPAEDNWEPVNKKRCKGKWGYDAALALADDWWESMPDAVHDMVQDPHYKGGNLLVGVKKGKVFNPKKMEIERNKVWAEAMAKHNPTKVGSTYFYADALLLLDEMFGGKLLIPPSGIVKQHYALSQAKYFTRMGASLRTLFRNAGHKSKSETLRKMKAHLKKRKRTDSASDDPDNSSESGADQSGGERSASEHPGSTDSDSAAEFSDAESSVDSCGTEDSDAHSNAKSSASKCGSKKSASDSGDEKSGAESAVEKAGAKSRAEESGPESGGEKSGAESGVEKSGAESGGEKTASESRVEKSGAKSGAEESGTESGGEKSGAESGVEKSGSESGGEKSGAESGVEKSGSESGAEMVDVESVGKKSGSETNNSGSESGPEDEAASTVIESADEADDESMKDSHKESDASDSDGEQASESASSKPNSLRSASACSPASGDRDGPQDGTLIVAPLTEPNVQLQELRDLWVRQGLPIEMFSEQDAQLALSQNAVAGAAATAGLGSDAGATRSYSASTKRFPGRTCAGTPSSVRVTARKRLPSTQAYSDEQDTDKALANAIDGADPGERTDVRTGIANIQDLKPATESLPRVKEPRGLGLARDTLAKEPPPVVVQKRKARATKESAKSGSSDAGGDGGDKGKPKAEGKKRGRPKKEKVLQTEGDNVTNPKPKRGARAPVQAGAEANAASTRNLPWEKSKDGKGKVKNNDGKGKDKKKKKEKEKDDGDKDKNNDGEDNARTASRPRAIWSAPASAELLVKKNKEKDGRDKDKKNDGKDDVKKKQKGDGDEDKNGTTIWPQTLVQIPEERKQHKHTTNKHYKTLPF